MPQIFPPWANRAPLFLGAGLAVGALAATAFIWYYFSPKYTDVGYQPVQPVPYSHALHVGELGLDCRYCHSSVETAAVASIPPTATCMNCHQLVGRDKETLEPIRQSFSTGKPMRWIRIHKMPDYAYFDHSMHLRAGVGCSSCHGDVAAMEVVQQIEPLSMGWCLDCHRDPTPHLRPRSELFNTAWQPPDDPQQQVAFASQVSQDLVLAPPEDCSACHR